MIQKKVTVYEITHIPAGETRTFRLPTGKALYSAKNTAYQMPKLNPRDDVERYQCKYQGMFRGAYVLSIKAIPKTESHDEKRDGENSQNDG